MILCFEEIGGNAGRPKCITATNRRPIAINVLWRDMRGENPRTANKPMPRHSGGSIKLTIIMQTFECL
ncbi:hypothetical protein GCM10007939_05280 [Amylibacter marinus]|uniref:Uncharacterized protein n=1 Tax=Amylibacter marinus TaxID=1475483 RepID=A0ABQ5VSD6_9RHOB|nr:hypothetical protein GCM10007939_05280 [Amylibacter marinus]